MHDRHPQALSVLQQEALCVVFQEGLYQEGEMSIEYYSVIDEQWHAMGRALSQPYDTNIYDRYHDRGFIRQNLSAIYQPAYIHHNKPAFEAYIKSLEEKSDE